MARKAAAAQDAQEDRILHLKPEEILADDNIRFSLREGDVVLMMESIVDRGGVQEPISVEPNTGDGPKYRLLKGFIRHAAVSKLNKEDGAGLTLPAIVRSTSSGVDRLKTQIAENVARSAMTPMDVAMSMRRLLDAGVSKIEIRKMFARPGVGRPSSIAGQETGGGRVRPIANSLINIHLNMLDLPPDIQEKIHLGLISTWAAYELGKVPAERRAAVLARAENEMASREKEEEKDEERFLKAEQADAKEAEKAAKLAEELEAAKAFVPVMEAKVAEVMTALRAVQAETYDPADAKAKAAYMEKLGAAETDVKAAQKLKKDAANKVSKLMGNATKAEELKEKLRAAREGTPAPAQVGPADIKAAADADAAAQGGEPAQKKLSASEIRTALVDIETSKNSLVVGVCRILRQCFDGGPSPKMAMEDLEKLLNPAVRAMLAAQKATAAVVKK